MNDIYSKHGYWINPDGEVFAMQKMQDHGPWIVASGIYPGRSFEHDSDAVQAAVEDGWIAVSFPPFGSGAGIRVRTASVEKDVVARLREILKGHDLMNTTVWTDQKNDLGKNIVSELSWTSYNRRRFPERSDEIAHWRSELRDRAVNLAREERIAASVRQGLEPDYASIRSEVFAVYDLYNEIAPFLEAWPRSGFKSLDDAKSFMRGTRELLQTAAAAISNHLTVVSAKIFGIDDIDAVGEVSVGLPATFETPEAEIAVLRKAVRTLESRLFKLDYRTMIGDINPALQSAYSHVVNSKHSVQSVSSKLAEADKRIDAPNADMKTVESVYSYWYGHECGRIFHVVTRIWAMSILNDIKAAEIMSQRSPSTP